MAESFHTNLVSISASFIKEAGLKITASSLKENLTQDPYYPSLYSLSEVFNKFNIDNKSVKVGKEDIDNLPTPFIAYMSGQSTGKDFVAVISVKPDEVSYFAEGKKRKTVRRDDFEKNWLGIILLAEPGEKSGESGYPEKRKKEIAGKNQTKAIIIGAIGVFSIAVFFFLYLLDPSRLWSASLLLLIKSAGLATAVLLLIYEIDKSNTFVKNICSAGRQTNCEAVLGSKASRVLGMSWSEAGFFYFASTFLFLLLPGIDFSVKRFVLAIANLIAVPYILFSIYYQWRVVRQWCPLCLTVQMVLLSELLWSVKYVWTDLPAVPLLDMLPIVVWCVAVTIIGWYVIKPILKEAKNAPLSEAAYKRLLYNPETFDHLLRQQAVAPDGYNQLGITIGNPEAENTIIKVCNPYCGPCARAHPVLDEIVRNNPHVKLKLIFTATNDANDPRGVVARHLLAISKKQSGKTEQALDDWYLAEKKDYHVFAAKYRLNGELKEQEAEIDKMESWCKEAEIMFTPTIYVNGYRLPRKYGVEELKFVLT